MASTVKGEDRLPNEHKAEGPGWIPLSAQGDETSINWGIGQWGTRVDDLFDGSSMGKGSEVRNVGPVRK